MDSAYHFVEPYDNNRGERLVWRDGEVEFTPPLPKKAKIERKAKSGNGALRPPPRRRAWDEDEGVV